MSEQLAIQSVKKIAPNAIVANGHLLQRKCACGQHTIAGGECEACKKKREATLQRAAISASPMNDVRRSPGQPLNAGTRAFMEPRFGHDFSQIHLHTEPSVDRDASDEEEKAPVAELGQKETLGGEAPDQQTSAGGEAELAQSATPLDSGSGSLTGSGSGNTAACPTKTVVEKLINQSADGKKFRTGMGAVAIIKVEPDKQNWDGTGIVESFPKPLTSDCPKEFGISPCSGHSTFIVGAKRDSPVFGSLAATSNRFYDFHETRWKGGSLLHDRNPDGKDSCKIGCEQQYSCGGAIIGTHTITRTFTKGKVGSVGVTLVNVSKT